jgi:hypothetical protein
MLVRHTARQRATHQHPRTIADPVTHLIIASRISTELTQHDIDGSSQVRHRVDQGAIQIEHHQLWQFSSKQIAQ